MFLTFLFFGIQAPALAQGDLLIYPKRLVFEGTQQRVQTLHLSNIGKDTAVYQLSYVQIRMTPEGEFENITELDPGQKFASPYLRFFPRTVTLAPNEGQTVKVQLIRTSELEDGEYRSHLYFRGKPKPNKDKEFQDADPKGLNIKLTPIYGISIANIIKIGESDTRVELKKLKIEKTGSTSELSFDIQRDGNMSVYGDITVHHLSPSGRETQVAIIKGLAVYAPGIFREISLKLNTPEDVNLEQGTLKVLYSSPEEKTILAEAVLDL